MERRRVDSLETDKTRSEHDRPSARIKSPKPTQKKKRMARSDLLVALVKAGATGDRHLARTCAEALIADERGKQHNVLADRLSSALRIPPNGSYQQQQSAPQEPAARGPLTRDLFVDRVPQHRLSDLLLPDVTRDACEALIEEQRRADVLRSHALEPRHRVL